MMKNLILISVTLFLASCEKGPQCNYQAGWDEYGGEYLTEQEAEELQASCLKTLNDVDESFYD